MDPKQTLVSVPQFANTLGITVSCVRRWILLRKINTIKVGRLVRIPCSEINRLIDIGLRPARPGR
jgi:excisionase family DNA binding protein